MLFQASTATSAVPLGTYISAPPTQAFAHVAVTLNPAAVTEVAGDRARPAMVPPNDHPAVRPSERPRVAMTPARPPPKQPAPFEAGAPKNDNNGHEWAALQFGPPVLDFPDPWRTTSATPAPTELAHTTHASARPALSPVACNVPAHAKRATVQQLPCPDDDQKCKRLHDPDVTVDSLMDGLVDAAAEFLRALPELRGANDLRCSLVNGVLVVQFIHRQRIKKNASCKVRRAVGQKFGLKSWIHQDNWLDADSWDTFA